VDISEKRVLVTGAAGFIGGSVLSRLRRTYPGVHGIDNFSNYYDPRLKHHHIQTLAIHDCISKVDVCDYDALESLYLQYRPDVVIHLAAQGGVRASQIDPKPYIQTNQMGFLNLLELNNKYHVALFIYASSSSVYGEGLPAPFTEEMLLPGPKSLYAASKIANEIMAKHFPLQKSQYRIGLRFFTVYGPWGRPDMAVSRLLASGYKERPFILTANKDLLRDFTYVEDVTDVIEDLLAQEFNHPENHTLMNVAGESPRSMGELITVCQSSGIPLNVIAGEINSLDVAKTHGSSEKLRRLGLRIPQTSLEMGIERTSQWLAKFSVAGLTEFLD
jgi:UDP-glucuronate 4-epimerase